MLTNHSRLSTNVVQHLSTYYHNVKNESICQQNNFTYIGLCSELETRCKPRKERPNRSSFSTSKKQDSMARSLFYNVWWILRILAVRQSSVRRDGQLIPARAFKSFPPDKRGRVELLVSTVHLLMSESFTQRMCVIGNVS